MTPEERYARNRLTDHPGGGEQLTKQAFKEETDINFIVNTYKGQPNLGVEPRQWIDGDITASVDLLEAYETVRLAEEGFFGLPAAVRAAAGNNPARLLEMLADPVARKALADAGLPLAEGPGPGVPDPKTPGVVGGNPPPGNAESVPGPGVS